MKVGRFEVTDVAPLSPYNRGFLEGATWQEGLTRTELEAAKRRISILELKLKAAGLTIEEETL